MIDEMVVCPHAETFISTTLPWCGDIHHHFESNCGSVRNLQTTFGVALICIVSFRCGNLFSVILYGYRLLNSMILDHLGNVLVQQGPNQFEGVLYGYGEDAFLLF